MTILCYEWWSREEANDKTWLFLIIMTQICFNITKSFTAFNPFFISQLLWPPQFSIVVHFYHLNFYQSIFVTSSCFLQFFLLTLKLKINFSCLLHDRDAVRCLLKLKSKHILILQCCTVLAFIPSTNSEGPKTFCKQTKPSSMKELI